MKHDENGYPVALDDEYWIHLWDLTTGNTLSRFRIPAENYAVGLDFSPDGTMIACRAGFATFVWETSTGKELARFGSFGPVGGMYGDATRPIAFTPDGKWLFSEYEFRSTSDWDVSRDLKYTGTAATPRFVKGDIVHPWPYSCLACDFTPDGRAILISIGNRLTLVNIETGHLEREFIQFKRSSGILSVAISPDGRMAASGGDGIVPNFGYGSNESWRNLCFWRMPNTPSGK